MAAYPAVVLAIAHTHSATSSAPPYKGRACSNAHTPLASHAHTFEKQQADTTFCKCRLSTAHTHTCVWRLQRVRGRQTHSHAHAWSLTHRQTLAPALTAGAETQTLGVHHTHTQSSADSVLTKMKLKKRLSKFNRKWVISLLTSNWLSAKHTALRVALFKTLSFGFHHRVVHSSVALTPQRPRTALLSLNSSCIRHIPSSASRVALSAGTALLFCAWAPQ